MRFFIFFLAFPFHVKVEAFIEMNAFVTHVMQPRYQPNVKAFAFAYLPRTPAGVDVVFMQTFRCMSDETFFLVL